MKPNNPDQNPIPPTLLSRNSSEVSRWVRHVVSLGAILSAFLEFGAQAQYSPPTSGLVSWWRAEGNATDSADSNHGSLLNGASYAPGLFGSSYSYDGLNDHVRVADNANLRLTTAITLGAWVNPSAHGAYHSIIDKWDIVGGVNGRAYSFAIHPNGEAYLTLSAAGTDALVGIAFTTNTAIALNAWTHLAASYDGANVRIYVDGLLKGQTAYSSGIFPGTDDLGIGGTVGGGAVGQVLSAFSGQIDEAVIYNRALSPNEILTLATVPEPSTMGLILLGFAGMVFKARKR